MDFYYKAKAANGSIMRGSKAADSEPEVIAWIRDNGWTPINIQSASSLKQSTAPPGQQQAAGGGFKEFFDFSPKTNWSFFVSFPR